MIPPCYDIPARVRPITKKALVIGISYREPVGELGPIPTSVPNVEKITRLLRGKNSISSSVLSFSLSTPSYLLDRGYTITVMTDGDTVAKESQPTGVNLVCPLFKLSLSTRPCPNDTLLQRREIGALCHGAQPGDRHVFYCMDLPSQHLLSPTLMLLPLTSHWPFRPNALQVRQPRGRWNG